MGANRRYWETLSSLASRLSLDDMARAVELIATCHREGNTVYIMGNGGSAATSIHLAGDLAKSAGMKARSLNENLALVSAWTNDNGFASIYVEQLRPWLKAGDVVIGISVHGGSGKGGAGPWSQNLGAAVELAKERGAKTIGLSGFDGGYLRDACDVCITVPMDEEPLATPIIESLHSAIAHYLALEVKRRKHG